MGLYLVLESKRYHAGELGPPVPTVCKTMWAEVPKEVLKVCEELATSKLKPKGALVKCTAYKESWEWDQDTREDGLVASPTHVGFDVQDAEERLVVRYSFVPVKL